MQIDNKSNSCSLLSLERHYIGDVKSLALDPECLFQIPNLPFMSCVTLGKLLNLFVLQLPIYKMGMGMILKAPSKQENAWHMMCIQ